MTRRGVCALLLVLALIGAWMMMTGFEDKQRQPRGLSPNAASPTAADPVQAVGESVAIERRRLETPPARPREPVQSGHEPDGVRVRVLDSLGRPAADVPVAMITVERNDVDCDLWTVNTDAAGRAVVPASRPSRNDREDRHRVVAAIPLAEACESIVTARNYDEEHLLRLPPTGSARVELLSSDGRPFRGEVALSLKRRLPDEQAQELPEILDFVDDPRSGAVSAECSAGVVAFPWIGLDLDLMITVKAYDTETILCLEPHGPVSPGEEIRVRFDALPNCTILQLPLLDPSGEPLRSATVRSIGPIFDTASGPQYWSELRTNPEGILDLVLTPGNESEIEESFLFLNPGDAVPWMAHASFRHLALPDGTRLPALRFEVAPLFAAGLVCDVEGTPVPGASLNVYLHYSKDRAFPRIHDSTTDADGRFEIRGFADRYEHSIYARAGNRSGGIPLSPGRTDHRVVLEYEEPVLDWIDSGAIQVEEYAELNRGMSTESLGVGGVIHNYSRDNSAGRLRLLDRFTNEELACLDLTGDPATDELLLKPWDLRGRFRVIRVLWNRADPLPPDWSIAISPPLEHYLDEKGTDDRAVEFLTARESLDLWIHAQGFRPRFYADVQDEVEVKLERGIPASCRLANRDLLELAPWVGVQFWPEDGQNVDNSFLSFKFDAQGRTQALLPMAGAYLVSVVCYEAAGPGFSNWLAEGPSVKVLLGEHGIDDEIVLQADAESSRQMIEKSRR